MRLGIDLVGRDELDRLLDRGWFRRYVFADRELAEAAALTGDRRREYLAGRFAAKEAVLKVLGAGLFDGIAPREITVERAPAGEPVVTLHGAAADAAQHRALAAVTVSITHKERLVAAVAMGW